MSLPEGIVYPESHPKGKEIRDIQIRMNDRYASMKELDEKGREAYKQAMKQLKLMGECRDESYQILKDAANDLEELQELVVMPLL